MATLNEISYNIARLLGKNTDPQTIAQVKFNVLYYRALLIRRSLERNPDMFETGLYSILRCVPMEKVNAVECPIDVVSCQWFMRSEKPIPKPVHTKGDPFIYVGTVDGMRGFSWASPVALDKLKFNRYTPGDSPRYFYLGDYLYIMNAFPEQIRLVGIFEDPTKFRSITGCDGKPVYNSDEEFPMPLDMVQQVTVSLLSGEYRLLKPAEDEDVTTG